MTLGCASQHGSARLGRCAPSLPADRCEKTITMRDSRSTTERLFKLSAALVPPFPGDGGDARASGARTGGLRSAPPCGLDDADINLDLSTQFQRISGFGGMNQPRCIKSPA